VVRPPAPSGEKVIGVLGGMGPEATLAFYEKLIANTPAARDQDHLRVVIDSNPKVPDRTAALLGLGRSPLPLMVAGMEALARAGADFVVIPCVSAHGFLDDLRRQARLPLLSALDAMADHLRQHHPRITKVGLLATSGTIDSGAFPATLERAGVQVLVPDAAGQARVMAAIYAIKRTVGGARGALGEDLRRVAERLVALGAQGIVLGCTEIPLVLGGDGLGVPVFDVVRVLARASIAAAGRVPVVEGA
jgi:aspartate racemase